MFFSKLDIPQGINYLLNKKALKINASNIFDDTALHLAVKNGHVECVKELLKSKTINYR